MKFPSKSHFVFILIYVTSIIGNSRQLVEYESENLEHHSVEEFILNGSTAEPGEFPHQVSLYSNIGNEPFCGGSIISPNLILTAAHCLVNTSTRDFKVIAGLTDLTLIQEGNEQSARKPGCVYIHEDYEAESLLNDIAIIELDSPLVFNDHVRNISLARKSETFNGKVTVIGWGSTEYGPHSNKLKKAIVRIIKTDRCREIYKNSSFPVTENNLCAGLRGAGTCHGDSGGPAICGRPSENEARVLCGIVSFGNPDCGKSPGVFTRVAVYIDWIEQVEDYIKTYKNSAVKLWNSALERPRHCKKVESAMRNNVIQQSTKRDIKWLQNQVIQLKEDISATGSELVKYKTLYEAAVGEIKQAAPQPQPQCFKKESHLSSSKHLN